MAGERSDSHYKHPRDIGRSSVCSGITVLHGCIQARCGNNGDGDVLEFNMNSTANRS